MTSNELLNASLLDILFDGRNKSYGAYVLRKDYDRRMIISLMIGLSLALTLIMIKGSGNDNNQSLFAQHGKDSVTITEIVEPVPKNQPLPAAVVQLKSVLKSPPATIANPPIKLVPDELADKNPPVSQDELIDKLIADKSGDGKPYDGTVTDINNSLKTGGTGEKEIDAAPVFIPEQADPQFPGGPDALRKFLSRNLNTPEELELGQRKMVKARFRVDKDGTVTLVEIELSGGNLFDKEVIRVCKKMPKWKPAIQNGQPVPVSYVLPVTFVGEEQ